MPLIQLDSLSAKVLPDVDPTDWHVVGVEQDTRTSELSNAPGLALGMAVQAVPFQSSARVAP
jgi:hypothetical protein